jgi:diadenylate cyclase
MMDTLSRLLPNVGIGDVLDIALVAVVLYVLLVALKRTRTTFLIPGIGLLTGLYVLALALDLRLTGYLFRLLFTVILIGLIILFHEEIRVWVERVLSLPVRRPHGSRQESSAHSGTVETLVDTVTDLARARTGALIVIRGKDDPSRFIRGGARLDGILSEPLLKSIFDPHSIGHDGAVLVTQDRVERFACHLPLSSNADQIGNRGTRHAAALGLAEKTDCLCLVVSEERGTISVARDGRLQELPDLSGLNRALDDFYREISPEQRRRPFWADAVRRHLGLKAAALAVAMLLWFFVVHESSTEYRTFMVPLRSVGLREGFTVTSTEPAVVQIVVSGPRRSFYLTDEKDVGVVMRLFDRGAGSHEIFLTATEVSIPEGLTIVNIVPRLVRVTVGE